MEAPKITQLEFTEKDHEIAQRVAKRLGYLQTAYTSSSALWGLFCLPENPRGTTARGRNVQHACIIKTREFGLMVVQDLEDLGLDQNGEVER